MGYQVEVGMIDLSGKILVRLCISPIRIYLPSKLPAYKILTRMPPIAKFSNLPAFSEFSSISCVGIGHHVWGYVGGRDARGGRDDESTNHVWSYVRLVGWRCIPSGQMSKLGRYT